MLDNKEPVFDGAAPSTTLLATHGRQYFLSGTSDRHGLSHLTPRTKANPERSVKTERAADISSSKGIIDSPLSPLTPVPKRKMMFSKGKRKEQSPCEDNENSDDEPVISRKRSKASRKPTTVLDDDDNNNNNMYIADSDDNVEEVASFSSTRLQSQGRRTQLAKKTVTRSNSCKETSAAATAAKQTSDKGLGHKLHTSTMPA